MFSAPFVRAWPFGHMVMVQHVLFHLKAQVSFSDQNLSVVRCCRCRHRRKLFTCSSSPEPLGQFRLNLAQSIFDFIMIGWPVND